METTVLAAAACLLAASCTLAGQSWAAGPPPRPLGVLIEPSAGLRPIYRLITGAKHSVGLGGHNKNRSPSVSGPTIRVG
jgi:hypothetical protein